MINVVAHKGMSEWQIESIMANLGEVRYQIDPTISSDGTSGTGGIDTTVYTKAATVCPAGRTCIPAGDPNGMFVRDIENNRIYFSDKGYERAVLGADINWPAVAADLLHILANSGGSVAMGVWGVIWMLTDIASWGIKFVIKEEQE